MATHARLSRHGRYRAVFGLLVASRARGIVASRLAAGRLMRGVAGQARCLAFHEARALRQVHRLVARIPRIAPLGLRWIARRLAVAGSAHQVHLRAGQLARIAQGLVWRGGMNGTRAMACLTLHTGFGRLDAKAFTQPQRPRGMALEALQDRGAGIEGPVRFTKRVTMPRRDAQPAGSPVVTQALLDIVIFVDAADECHRLISAAEGPIRFHLGKPRAQRVRLERKQRSRMAGFRLRGGLRGMARRANASPNELLARSDPGQRDKQEQEVVSTYQTSLPLN